ncbi:MAG: PD-(D/E)XK nuclease family protein [Alphaproteobacteria bacterium]|nr:PD-(D/E)XK nuclease family protein [Alphaproteobacteria bacterium]
MGDGRVKNVFTIDPQLPFLDTLAREIVRRHGGGGLDMADTLVLLPTRRACRHLGEAFARLAQGKPVLLPRLQPLGDIDEDDMAFADAAGIDVPPAIPAMKRLMLLTQQVQRRDPSLSYDQAAQAADALARFLDQIQIERCDIGRLPELVKERELAAHWEQTIEFLHIVTQFWPGILAAEGCVDPAARRNAVLQAQADMWRRQPPVHAVIAAGSTGSVPATADLLDVIAGLPRGAVILPGLDRSMENDAWDEVGDTHPQHSMKRLLQKMDVDRRAVQNWGDAAPASPRVLLINEAMRPAALTETWRDLRGALTADGTAGLERLTLDHPHEEAQAIALRLRAFVETPHGTAALVTADRGLAARVAAQLRRWHIEVDDSGGASLAVTPPGVFLNLVLAAAAPHAGAVDILALLKHPLAACGMHPAACRDAARAGEVNLRNDGVEDFAAIRTLLRPLTGLWRDHAPLAQRIDTHIAVAQAIAASDSESGAARLWYGDAGDAAAAWLDEWRDAARDFPALDGDDYAGLFDTLANAKTVRTAASTHPRLAILGPLEARLIGADLVILGGMNEGVWPPDAGFDPWMSRPMRKSFGLPSPEFRIGLSAHDFAHLACAPQVFITRSMRSGGTPTTASRFLLHIDAVLRAAGLGDGKDPLAPREPWQAWAQDIDRPEKIAPCPRPQPRPPVATRPTALSVTEIGTWLRNPYAIYARHILGLRKLDELDAEPDAADRGNMIHAALEKFMRACPAGMPDDALPRLLDIGRGIFAEKRGDARVQAFWWARFVDIATWFVAHERARRMSGITSVAVERSGRVAVGGILLKGRVDRIDRAPDGALSIIDYKTGGVPAAKDVESGLEPQLPLLALMAQRHGFDNVAPAAIGTMEYWALKGGRGGFKINIFDEHIADMQAKAEAGLKKLAATFADAATPYEAVPRPRWQPDYNDYAHLSRMAEWGRSTESGDA